MSKLQFPTQWRTSLGSRISASDLAGEAARIEQQFAVDPLALAARFVDPMCRWAEGSTTALQLLGEIIEAGPRQLLLCGPPASGKTSVAIMLKLAHLVGLWPPDYSCLLLRMDELEALGAIEQRQGVVLLLDGLDDASRLSDLWAATEGFWRVFVTCRPEALEEPDRKKAAQLLLLTDEQADDYLQKHFPGRGATAEELARIEGSRDVVELLRSEQFRPLLLAYAEDVLRERRIGWSAFGALEVVVAAWVQQEVARHPELGEEMLWSACEALAGKQLQPGDSTNAQATESLAPLSGGNRSLIDRSPDGHLRFVHEVISDFVVVKLIVENRLGVRNMRLTKQQEELVKAYFKVELFRRLSIRSKIEEELDGVAGPATIHVRQFGSKWNVSIRGTLRRLRGDGLQLSWAAPLAIRPDCCDLDLVEAQLTNAKLQGVDLSRALLRNAKLSGSDLTSANLTDADLRGADLSSATLVRSKLVNGKLAGATLDGISGYRVDLDDATLEAASLQGADLREANLSTAALHGCNLAGSKMNGTKLIGAKLQNANLSRVDLRGANLSWADFRGSNLENADLMGADLTEANLEGANLEGAKTPLRAIRIPGFQGRPFWDDKK